MLMQNYEVRDIIRPACLRKLFDDIVASVDAMRIREHKTHFLDTGNVSVTRSSVRRRDIPSRTEEALSSDL